MKNKIIYILAIILIIELGIVFSEMGTNARYSASVDLYSDLDLASTYYNGTLTTSSPVSITLGEKATVQYSLTNDVSDNVNQNNLNFYLNLLDENNEEATKITIEYIKYNDTRYYDYVEGKGFGPISLAYDGITEDTKTIYIRLLCSNNFSSRQTVNYKINLLAEDTVNSSINKNQTSNIALSVNLNTITYVLNGGVNNSGNPAAFAPNATVALSNPSKDGYVFVGWYESSDFSGSKVKSISGRSEDVTLYAKWGTLYKYYFQLPPDWNGTSVYAYLYSIKSGSTILEQENVSAGQLLTLKDNTKNIYELALSDVDVYEQIELGTYTKIGFSNNGTIDDQKGRVTQDIAFSLSDAGKVFVPELYHGSNEVRVFGFGSDLSLYLWKDKTNNGWPGTSLTDFQTLRSAKYVINKNTYSNMIFSNVKSDGRHQTEDLTVPVYQDLTYKLTEKNSNRKI